MGGNCDLYLGPLTLTALLVFSFKSAVCVHRASRDPWLNEKDRRATETAEPLHSRRSTGETADDCPKRLVLALHCGAAVREAD
ncbi:hypothetical protein SRHO_G00088210 [Serrasalmus rhombeus]